MGGDLTEGAQPTAEHRWARRVTLIGALFACAVGSLALFAYAGGAHGESPAFSPYSPAMKPNTALCLTLLGLALILMRPASVPFWQPRALVPAGLAALIGLLTLSEYVFGWDLGIDQLLFVLPRPRMSPISACALSSLASVMVLTALGIRATAVCQALLAFSGLLSLLPIMGYLYRAPFLYNPGSLTAVAPGTGASALMLMAATFALHRDEGLWPLLVGDTAGSTLLRRALPAVVMFPVGFGWLRLEAERLANVGLELGVALIAVATVLTFAALLLWSARWLRDQDLARRAAIENLSEARNTLEARVQERTSELSNTEVELRRTARTLLLAKEAAERAMQARTDFLARMSHEMRTPLNGVVGMLEIALRSNLTAAQRGYVQTARSSADALLSLISDVLDFSKIDADKLLLESTHFQLRDCLAHALRDSAPAAHQKGLELQLSVARELPDCLVGDSQRLRQVLTNLVSNAVKFTSQGEVQVSVALVAQREQAVELRFEVRDTGVGIDLAKQREIFQAFTQGDESTTRRYGGTGLGLSISAQLAALMGGELKVESEPGHGARFWFQLELKFDAAREAELDAAQKQPAGTRALLVEPSQHHREYARNLLERWGIESVFVEAKRVERALADAARAKAPFALLLIDDAAAATLEALPAVRPPMVLMTLATEPDRGREARLKQCSAHLTKPLVASELFETVSRLVAEPGQAVEGASAQAAPLHVLVVEDNETNRRVACFLLESAGYSVVAVEDGRKALAVLAERDFDVVLMDGHMPHLDGIEATREIRARERGQGRHTPIIALTAQAMKGDRERYLAAGMDGYVTKPFQSAQLLATIREVVARSRKPSQPPSDGKAAASAVAAPAPLRGLTPTYEREQLVARLRGAERLLQQTLRIFAEEAPVLMEALEHAVAAREVVRVQHAAHKLAGALLTVGGARAAEMARSIENSMRESGESALMGLDTRTARLRVELSSLLEAMMQAGDLERAPVASA